MIPKTKNQNGITHTLLLCVMIFLLSSFVLATPPNDEIINGLKHPFFQSFQSNSQFRLSDGTFFLRNLLNASASKSELGTTGVQPIITDRLGDGGINIITTDASRLRVSQVNTETGAINIKATAFISSSVTAQPETFDWDNDGNDEIILAENNILRSYEFSGSGLTLESSKTFNVGIAGVRCYNVTGFTGIQEADGLRCGVVLDNGLYIENNVNGSEYLNYTACSTNHYQKNGFGYPPHVTDFDEDSLYEMGLFCNEGTNDKVVLKVFQNNGTDAELQFSSVQVTGGVTTCNNFAQATSQVMGLSVIDVNDDGTNELITGVIGCTDFYYQDYTTRIINSVGTTLFSNTDDFAITKALRCNGATADVCYFTGATPVMTADVYSDDLGEEWILGLEITASGGAPPVIASRLYVFGDDRSQAYTEQDFDGFLTGFEPDGVYDFTSYYTSLQSNGVTILFFTTNKAVFEYSEVSEFDVSTRLQNLSVKTSPYIFSMLTNQDGLYDLVGTDGTLQIYTSDNPNDAPFFSSVTRDTGNPVCNSSIVTFETTPNDLQDDTVKMSADCYGNNIITENNIFQSSGDKTSISCIYNITGFYVPILYLTDSTGANNSQLMKPVNVNTDDLCLMSGEGGFTENQPSAQAGTTVDDFQQNVKDITDLWNTGTRFTFAIIFIISLIISLAWAQQSGANVPISVYGAVVFAGVILTVLFGWIPTWVIVVMTLIGVLAFLMVAIRRTGG